MKSNYENPDLESCEFEGDEKWPVSQTDHENNLKRFAGQEVPNELTLDKEEFFGEEPYDVQNDSYVSAFLSRVALFDLLGQTPEELRDPILEGILFSYAVHGGDLVVLAGPADCNMRIPMGFADDNLLSLAAPGQDDENTRLDEQEANGAKDDFLDDHYKKVIQSSHLTVKFRKSQIFALLAEEAYGQTDGFLAVKGVIAYIPKAGSARLYLGFDVLNPGGSTNDYAYGTDPCPPVCYD